MASTTIELERQSGRREPEPPAADSASPPPDTQPVWTPAQRVVCRFVFAYLVLYILPFPLEWGTNGWYASLWHALVPWVGRRIFHVEITVFTNGSGDTTFNYGINEYPFNR
jgi:hypothetical protein